MFLSSCSPWWPVAWLLHRIQSRRNAVRSPPMADSMRHPQVKTDGSSFYRVPGPQHLSRSKTRGIFSTRIQAAEHAFAPPTKRKKLRGKGRRWPLLLKAIQTPQISDDCRTRNWGGRPTRNTSLSHRLTGAKRGSGEWECTKSTATHST